VQNTVDYEEDLLGLTDALTKKLLSEVDKQKIRQEVFDLFEINCGCCAQLSLRKVHHLDNMADESMQDYLSALDLAHGNFLNSIMLGHKFAKMEENPAKTKDMNYGVPKLFNIMFEQLLEADAYGDEYEEEDGSGNENPFEDLPTRKVETPVYTPLSPIPKKRKR